MAKTSVYKLRLTTGLTHRAGQNTLVVPYKVGDVQADFSTTVGLNALLVNGGRLVLVDDTDTFTLAFNAGDITVSWLTPATSVGDTDDLLLIVNLFDNSAFAGSSLVDSVFGRAGVVVAAADDYSADQITVTPSGGIAAADVQAALEELDSEKSEVGHDHNASYAALSHVGTGGAAHADATTSVAGFMSAADKTKLNALITTFTDGTLLGRSAGSPGAPHEITVGTGLSLSAGVLSATGGGGGGDDDQTAAEVPFSPAGNIAATNVQAAIEELDSEKSATGHNHDASYSAIGHDHAGVYQPLDADLTAVAGLAATAGLLSRTGADAFAARTLTAPAAGITVSNGTGAAGNPTLALANDLSAVEGLATTGLVRRTGTDAWSAGTTVATAEITNAAVTYAKIQDVSAGDKLLGRVSGAGDVEEIACTAAGRALLDDAAASNQRVTLGVDQVGISAFHESPADKDYILVYKAPFAFTINTFDGKLASGTCSLSVSINSTVVTGLSGLSISSSNNNQTASALNSVVAGDTVKITVSSGSTPVDLQLTIKGTR